MLESASRVTAQMQNERVVLIRYLTTHEVDLSFDNLLNVAPHPFRIVVTVAINDDAMWNALNCERNRFEVANFKRRVIQRIKVVSPKSVLLASNSGQTRRHLPNVGSENPNCCRRA